MLPEPLKIFALIAIAFLAIMLVWTVFKWLKNFRPIQEWSPAEIEGARKSNRRFVMLGILGMIGSAILAIISLANGLPIDSEVYSTFIIGVLFTVLGLWSLPSRKQCETIRKWKPKNTRE